MQLFCSVFQILCLGIILLNAISQFVHSAGIGTGPYVTQLTPFQWVLQSTVHVLRDPRRSLEIYHTEVEAARSKIAITGLCVIVSSNNWVRFITIHLPIVGQQPNVMTGIYWLLPTFLTWLQKGVVGSFQIGVESTCQPRNQDYCKDNLKQMRALCFAACFPVLSGKDSSPHLRYNSQNLGLQKHYCSLRSKHFASLQVRKPSSNSQ